MTAQGGKSSAAPEGNSALQGEAIKQSKTQPRVTVRFKDTPVKEVVDAIVHQAKLKVLYNKTSPALSRRITVTVENLNVQNALAKVLAGTGLAATLAPDGETVTVHVVKGDSQQLDSVKVGTVNGVIIDSANARGISGVTVSVPGIAQSVVSGVRGEFSLNRVPVGEHTVTFKLVGYGSSTRVVTVTENGPVTLRVILKPVSTTLASVVTTATGKQRKYEIGNSITSINVDSVMQVAPITSLTDLLETRVPGLTVQRTSGAPGDPSRLRLRGVSSLNGNNDPIVVVDGVRMYAAQSDARNANLANANYAAPSPLDQIDPNTIETIDVFKGPSAAGMYGSDAANGVIVITTKRGRAGPARWDLTLNHGVAYLPGKYPEGLYRWGTLSLVGFPVRCSQLVLNCTLDSLVRYQALNDPYQTILAHGISTGIAVGVSGGTSALQYAFGATGSRDGDYLKLSDAMLEDYAKFIGQSPPGWMRKPGQYRRWSGNGSIMAQVTPQFTVRVTSSLFNSDQRRSSLGEGGLKMLMSEYLRPNLVSGSTPYRSYYEQVTSHSLSTMNSADVNWQAATWLPLTMTLGLQTLSRDDQSLIPRGVTRQWDPTDSAGRYSMGRGTTVTRTASVTTSLIGLRTWLKTNVGLTYTQESDMDMQASTRSLSPGVSLPNNGLTSTQQTGGKTMFGWFVEPIINLQSRFFISPGFRLDNNGLAGQSAKLMGLPKINLSWILSDESFFPKTEIVNMLRLRTGYGSSGVQPGPQDRLRLFTVKTAYLDPLYQNVPVLSSLGNTQLRPERGTEWEGGVDATLWNNRINIEVSGYRQMRYDAIEQILVAPSVGLSQRANIGVVRNMGVELSVSAQILERSALSWFISMSASRNTNLLQQLSIGSKRSVCDGNTGATLTCIAEGYPLFGWWAQPIVSYGDPNGNGVVEESEVVLGDSSVFLGQQDPRSTMTMNTNLTFLQGRLSLNATVAYTGQRTQFNNAENSNLSPFNLAANDPNASLAEQANAAAWFRTSYGLVQSVSDWRFQSLSLNYAVGPSIARRFRAKAMNIALQGSNLELKSNYSGKDPNVNSNPTGNATIDSGAQPQPRTWSLRVSLGW